MLIIANYLTTTQYSASISISIILHSLSVLIKKFGGVPDFTKETALDAAIESIRKFFKHPHSVML